MESITFLIHLNTLLGPDFAKNMFFSFSIKQVMAAANMSAKNIA